MIIKEARGSLRASVSYGEESMKEYIGLAKCRVLSVEDCPFHVCHELAVFYIIEGTLEFKTVSGTHILNQGQTEIINVKEPVAFSAPEGGSPAKILMLYFDKEYLSLLDYNFETVTFNCNVSNFFCVSAQPYQIQNLTAKMLSIVMDMVKNEPYQKVNRKSEELIMYIIKNFDDVSYAFEKESDQNIDKERFKRISEYMIGHVAERVSLSDIAQNEYLSIQYLSKKFAVHLDKNYHDILNYYRIINAVIQLLDTDDSLTFIAENSGFSSVRYYNKIFRDYMGVLPSKFRALNKNISPKITECEPDKRLLENILEKITSDILELDASGRFQINISNEQGIAGTLCLDGIKENAVYTFFVKENGQQKLIVVERENETDRLAKKIIEKYVDDGEQLKQLIGRKIEYIFLQRDEHLFHVNVEEKENITITVINIENINPIFGS